VEERLKEEQARQLAKDAAQQAREELSGVPWPRWRRNWEFLPRDPTHRPVRNRAGLGTQPAFNQAALRLKPQEISKVVELPEGSPSLKAWNIKPRTLPPLAQIKEPGEGGVEENLARKQAEQEATRALGNSGKESPGPGSRRAGLPVKDSGFFTRFQGFQGQRQAESITGAAFQLSRQHPYPEKPLWFQNQYYPAGL